MEGALLTTTEAARLAGVAPSTLKRWADGRLLPFTRTAGGHRRFQRLAVGRFLRRLAAGGAADPLLSSWIDALVAGRRHEIDGRLLEARARHGAWHRVADELGEVLVEMGRQWRSASLAIAEEHAASDSLVRALARVGEALPSRVEGPRCLLACAGDEDHTLGLSLAELCLRESGWVPLWLGRRTPVAEIVRLARSGTIAMVALSASVASSDTRLLGRIARAVGAACRKRAVELVLAGAGAWPERPAWGVRLGSFGAFNQHLARLGLGARPS